ncbi:MAG: flagellar filament capping protein FliD [Candidatus Adiutrix sp.]|jgi:flagellar hook-associated protein 2|nr:flagellar filament capping protein FliD [Candidatus Adiutrix sp.]
MSSTSSTSNTISGAIKWTGLTSGTDFKSMVDQLVAIEQRTVTRQETWKATWEDKLVAINTLDTRLTALKSGCESYDERAELLARAGRSSDEKVATVTNTSTAATGVYSIEVGENVAEKLASRTWRDDEVIGANYPVNANGDPVDSDGRVLVKAAFTLPSDYDFNAEGYLVYTPDGTVYTDNSVHDYIEDDPDVLHQPLTITMGGRTMTLVYNAAADPDSDVMVYSGDFTMEDLAKVINRSYEADPANMPQISAEVVYDRTRADGDYSRLVLTGLEGGQKNHIAVSDPTDLRMDKNSIEAPNTSSWFGSTVTPQVSADSAYTGHTNKAITVVVTAYTNNGVIGTDTVQFSWADTEGHSGVFTVRPDDWDMANNCLKEPVELLQGVKISFDGASGNQIVKDNAFTIDCQAPVMQQAADIGLAQTDKWVHRGVADLTSPVQSGGVGVFAYSYAGREYAVAVNDGLGLKGLVDKINNDENNPGVIASVLNDGMGTATSYKLVLTGHREGAEYGIRILDSTKLSKVDFGADTFEHAREASNSMCRVDGYPNDGYTWIQRSGNEVSDVLDGVVLTLEGPGTTQITIQNNVTEMKNRIMSIVEAVNYAKSYIKEQTKYGSGKLISKVLSDGSFTREWEGGEEKASGVMIGNYGFQIALSNIDNLMTKQIFSRDEYIKALDPEREKQALYPVTVEDEERDGPSQEGLYREYLDKNGLIYTRLSDIGIATNPADGMNGVYSIEESKLTEALTKNPEAVIKLFTFKPEEGFPTEKKYEDEDARPKIGGLCVMMGWAMSDLTRSSDVIDSSTGEVKQPAKGICKVLSENYNSIISGIDEKISRETRRIEMVRQRLEDKFARLETLLSSLSSQSSSIQAQIDKLNSN